MQVPTTSRHCYQCRQLDFLPFNCKYCHKDFCLEHRMHECLDKQLEQANKIVVSKKNKSIRCTVKSCKNPATLGVTCKLCKKIFCIEHRFHDFQHQAKNLRK